MYYSGWVFSGLLTDEERGPIMMKLDIVIPYQKKIQKVYKSRDKPLEFC